MELFAHLKEYVLKGDKIKQMITSTGLSPPVFITAITFAGAAAIAVATCYLRPKHDQVTNRGIDLEVDAINEFYPPSESQCSNRGFEEGDEEEEEEEEEEENGETSMVSLEDAATETREVVADLIEEYLEVETEVGP